jgi:hypothetical protein
VSGPLRAWYLPTALEEDLETTVQRFGPPHDAVELMLPVVTPEDASRWIAALRVARALHLVPRTTRAIAKPLERVARRFLDREDPVRREALDALARTGHIGAAEVGCAIDDAFAPLAGGGIARWVAAELGAADALDRLGARGAGPARRAHGPEWLLHVYAGNVPAVPVWPMFAALLLKSALLAKTASREPLLAPLLARAIAAEDAELGACIAVAWWKGGAAEIDRAALAQAPAVLAFGGGDAIAATARGARPDAILSLHGPKVSVACIAREAIVPAALADIATRAARDVALYDQQGCLSPHAIYVERGGRASPRDLAVALACALETAALEMPPPGLDAEEAARARLYRAQAEFDAAAGGDATEVFGSADGTAWTVVLERGARFEPGPGRRVLRIHDVDDLEEAFAALRPHAGDLEAVALEAVGPHGAQLQAAVAALGVPRVAALGRMQQPSPLGRHGGTGFLAPFVRWTTVDPRGRSGAAPRRAAAPRATRASASRPSARGSRPGGRGSRRSR